MFLQFRPDTPKGIVRTEISYCPLQRQGVAATADLGDGGKGAPQLAVRFAYIRLLNNGDFTERAVPVELFFT